MCGCKYTEAEKVCGCECIEVDWTNLLRLIGLETCAEVWTELRRLSLALTLSGRLNGLRQIGA